MAQANAAAELLQRHIADVDTQWSLGTFGGLAEFSRDRDEAVDLVRSGQTVSAVTARGGIAVALDADIRPFASEGLTKAGWSQRVALCLPEDRCAMNRRMALTELGADDGALRPQDRGSVLFDLGLGALQADLCVRIADAEVAARLRACAGRAVFEAGNPAMGIILQNNPHRVFISRIGRIEVYQPIPPASGNSPEGPHTHVLPKLLRANRTHAATEPVPAGWIPCAHLYPAHPARDGMGAPRDFDDERHRSFQRLLEAFGSQQSFTVKRQITNAIVADQPPMIAAIAQDRQGRTTARIALRQLSAAGASSGALKAWLEKFDTNDANTDDADDEAAQHGH